DDSGMYECRASNDPDRNHLSKSPKVKWIRSQANVFVIEREWPRRGLGTCSDTDVLSLLPCSPLHLCPVTSQRFPSPSCPGCDKVLQTDTESSAFTSYTIEGKMEEHSGVYDCVYKTSPVVKGQVNISVAPQVVAYKKSEHGNEGDTGELRSSVVVEPHVSHCPESCFFGSLSFQPIINGSGRYIIKSGDNKTELRILKLNIEEDTGDYHCNATNAFGFGGAVVNLRVRSRLAALWPFLGIVAEVLVLVTIIFIYEKRRKPDEVLDDDDGGSAPLKSNATNHKDKNVRQRNAN
ncbi:Basigin, partial [Tinamus guttatus]